MILQPAAGIILAAGRAERFGGAKLLAPLAGRPVIAWVVAAALASRLDRVLLVAGPDPQPLRGAIASLPRSGAVTIVSNPHPERGQSASLRAGLAPLAEECPAAVFLLGDQPLVTARLIDRLLDGLETPGRTIAVPVCRGRRGNPVAFARRHYPEILAVTGDEGARRVIAAHPEAVHEIAVDDARLFIDVDTPADLARIRAILSTGSPP